MWSVDYDMAPKDPHPQCSHPCEVPSPWVWARLSCSHVTREYGRGDGCHFQDYVTRDSESPLTDISVSGPSYRLALMERTIWGETGQEPVSN